MVRIAQAMAALGLVAALLVRRTGQEMIHAAAQRVVIRNPRSGATGQNASVMPSMVP
jgi:transcriptional regulator GlxA family with amidase domain